MDQVKDIDKFLRVVCLPASAELRILANDTVKEYRLRNVQSTLNIANNIWDSQNNPKGTIYPKVALSIIENCSNEEQTELQQLWAGLFVSSISEVPNDENILYANILKQLTVHEARIIKHVCEKCTIHLGGKGLPQLSAPELKVTDFESLIGTQEFSYLEALMGHIISLKLTTLSYSWTNWIFKTDPKDGHVGVEAHPTFLCFRLYLKSLGISKSVEDYLNYKYGIF